MFLGVITDAIHDLLRKLCFSICKPIYSLIPKVYNLFWDLAGMRFFSEGDSANPIKIVTSNVYSIVSVIMLFALSASLLSTIVNPDIINDKKKGVGAVIKRSIIGIALMVLIPIALNKAWSYQDAIVNSNLIPKLVVGISNDNSDKEAGPGNFIAVTLLQAVVHPYGFTSTNTEMECTFAGCDEYSKMQSNIDAMSGFTPYINVASDSTEDGYAYEFNSLVAIIAGGIMVYLLLIFAIDMAVRVFKLLFFELTAPISIAAYMAVGGDTLKKWGIEFGKAYAEVFVKIIVMSFYLLLISNFSNFVNELDSSGGWFTKVLVIIGMLIFVKQIPNLIKSVLGINIELKGGIGGRLGSMAAAGKQAQEAWNVVKKGAATVGLGAAGIAGAVSTLGLLPAAAGGAALGFAHHGWNKGFRSIGARAGKDTATGQVLRAGGSAAAAFFKSGNPIKGISAAGKAISESDIGKQAQANQTNRWNDSLVENAENAMDLNEDKTIKDGHKSSENLRRNLNREIRLSGAQKRATDNLMQANTSKAIVDNITKNKDEIKDKFNELISNTNDQELISKLTNIRNRFLAGEIVPGDMQREIMGLGNKIDKGDGAKLIGGLDSILNQIKTAGLTSSVIKDGKIDFKALAGISSVRENEVNAAKQQYDTIVGAASSDAKTIMSAYISNSQVADKKIVKEGSSTVQRDDAGQIVKNQYGGDSNLSEEYKNQYDAQNAQSSNLNSQQTAGDDEPIEFHIRNDDEPVGFHVRDDDEPTEFQVRDDDEPTEFQVRDDDEPTEFQVRDGDEPVEFQVRDDDEPMEFHIANDSSEAQHSQNSTSNGESTSFEQQTHSSSDVENSQSNNSDSNNDNSQQSNSENSSQSSDV